MNPASAEQPQQSKDPEQPTAPDPHTATAKRKAAEPKPSLNLSTFDSLLKYLAALSLLLYCCGYLVASVSSLEWGFYQQAPFRPRVASAGAWFIFFLGVPMAAAAYRRRLEKPESSGTPANFQFYATWGVALGFATGALFQTDSIPPTHTLFIPLLPIVGYVIIPAISGEGRTASTLRWIVSLTSVFVVAGSGLYDLIKYHIVTVSGVFLWYLVVGSVSNFTLNACKGRDFLEHLTRSVPQLVSGLLLALSYFGRVYYPQIKASWGGGAPVPVTILFVKESPILPGQYLSTQLLDESDAGLYIAGKGEKRASFIPRSEIASMTYSDSPSPLLQQPKK